VVSVDDRGEFYVRLSAEHTAATFAPDLKTSAEMVILHSKGVNSKALADLANLLPVTKR
jgi:hypothetical protein